MLEMAITLILTLTFVLLFLVYISTGLSHSFEIIVTIYGGFVATLIGVYWSFHLTNKQITEKEKKEKDTILLAALKLIFSELDVNKIYLTLLRNTIETMPQDISNMYNNFAILETAITSLKTQAFYGTIYSGNIKEITLKPNLFNPIQQAYFNMELGIASFNATRLIFKDFADHPKKFTQTEKNQALASIPELKINWTML